MVFPDQTSSRSGLISWMADHTVAANMVMVIFILGGLLVSTQIKQEVFPEFKSEIILCTVPYPGASPEEVEQGIILSIEDVVRGLDGVKEVTSTAYESMAQVRFTLVNGVNANSVLQDVINEIDRIRSFPELAERPVISLVDIRSHVLSVMVHGDLEEQILRDVAGRIRDDLMQRPGVTLVELDTARPREIAIEVPQRHLRAFSLTLDRIASEIREAAIELPGGGVKTPSGEVLLRTQERRDFGWEYAELPLVSTPDGSTITVGDIATITDGFAETDEEAYFNRRRAVQVKVFRVGTETPQSVSESVHTYLEELGLELPDGIGLTVWEDWAEMYRDRMSLLLKNAFLGLILVLLLLGLFLDLKLAFWVTVGLCVSIIGSFLFLPLAGASINMISLFAFIVTLGIVVDDAVVAGEIIYQKREQGLPLLQAAIAGAREIAGPITFAVLTNIAAFLPFFFLPGVMGNFVRQIPSVVVAVFAVSLIESLFVLPAHLAHTRASTGVWEILDRPRRWLSKKMTSFIQDRYQPFLRSALANRWLTVGVGVALLILTAGIVAGGHVPFTSFPSVDSDIVRVEATLPYGVSLDDSRMVLDSLQQAVDVSVEQLGSKSVLRGIYGYIGSFSIGQGPGVRGSSGSHKVGAFVWLEPSDQRNFSGVDFANAWRAAIGTIPGVASLTVSAETGPDPGDPIDIQLSHQSRPVLEAAARDLADALTRFEGVLDIDDGVSLGKPQLNFRITPEAHSLGLNATDVAGQVRGAFYGVEALRQQRGRDEVKVMVRLPAAERRSAFTVEHLILLTEQGGEIPLAEAADVEPGRSYTEIKRHKGRRIVAVTAEVDAQIANANRIIGELTVNDLAALTRKYPGLTYSLEGEQASQRETLVAMAIGLPLALLMIYGLLAIPFRSYVQPLIVMLGIPFGFIGALIGHLLLGYGLSLISLFGMVALAGVMVNDSLVLIATTNRIHEEQGIPLSEAVIHGAMNRFRPIVLTSLTTFFGLAPMMFETAMQARFLIPMAISLGFGILFGTVVILVIVPCVYFIVETLLRRDRPAMADTWLSPEHHRPTAG